MRSLVLALSAATLTLPVMPAAPAFAHDTRYSHAHDSRAYQGSTWRGSDGRPAPPSASSRPGWPARPATEATRRARGCR